MDDHTGTVANGSSTAHILLSGTLAQMAQDLVHHCSLGSDEHVLLIRMYRYVGKKPKVHPNDVTSMYIFRIASTRSTQIATKFGSSNCQRVPVVVLGTINDGQRHHQNLLRAQSRRPAVLYVWTATAVGITSTIL